MSEINIDGYIIIKPNVRTVFRSDEGGLRIIDGDDAGSSEWVGENIARLKEWAESLRNSIAEGAFELADVEAVINFLETEKDK